MEKTIRVLIIEDSEDDVLLIIRALKLGGCCPSYEQVEDADTMRKAIEAAPWDIILCDYQMPRFSGIDAIALLKEIGVDIPLIIVSGVIGEEMAAECMRLGAHDFFMKGNLTRLAFAVNRELKEAESRAKGREIEKQLRDSEDKFRYFYDHSVIGKSITFLNGKMEANNAFNEMLGYSVDEFKECKWQDITHPDDVELSARVVDSLLSGEKDSERFNKRYLHRNGSIVWTDVCTTLRRDEDGKPLYLMASISDITERKSAEEERLKLERELKHAHKMESIGILAGGIAHDFNNILTSIIGFTELSFDEVVKGSVIEDNLQEIYSAGKRAKDLVGQILAFARQSEGEIKPIQIDLIATEVLKFIRSTIPTSIEIRQNIDSDSLIMGNDTQVHQIFMNLLTNAAHAMESEGGILEFSLIDIGMDSSLDWGRLELRPGNYLEITLSDTGIGIDPEIIGSIFDPYFTTKGPGEGTGMGLAVVHGIVSSYGGRLLVDSKRGRGTRFTIYLPVTRKRGSDRQYEPELVPTGSEKILFVDDEASIVKMNSRTLQQLGYSVVTRTSSIEALELFRLGPDRFDLVVTDMTMPNMTGDKLARELLKIRADIPVILCTGYSKAMSDDLSSEIGVKALLYKPIVKAEFAKKIRTVLDEAMKSSQG